MSSSRSPGRIRRYSARAPNSTASTFVCKLNNRVSSSFKSAVVFCSSLWASAKLRRASTIRWREGTKCRKKAPMAQATKKPSHRTKRRFFMSSDRLARRLLEAKRHNGKTVKKMRPSETRPGRSEKPHAPEFDLSPPTLRNRPGKSSVSVAARTSGVAASGASRGRGWKLQPAGEE
ncbi:MAG: hypothetical protein PWP23_1054 [Candidatus Sumerlaeota bacterium]|nr:hypothetical protein [Candidatus Sumerlaeota bacterium]